MAYDGLKELCQAFAFDLFATTTILYGILRYFEALLDMKHCEAFSVA